MAVRLWGAFLIALGAGMLLFNRAYLAKARALFLPFAPSWFAKLMSVAVALAFIAAGVSAFVQR